MRDRSISGKTKLCGIIGDPVEHTMSPIIQNAAFRGVGLDYLYLPFKVKREELAKAIDGVRALNIRGLNVTIPHKVAILHFLDELDPLAEKIGAVNTVVNDDGVLRGYNTDATGFMQVLLGKGVEPEGKSVVIVGAGGASRGISFILAERGANLTILNRTLSKAKECADSVSRIFKRRVRALPLDSENLTKALEKADILVNATSVGMSPNIDETLVASNLLKPALTVVDAVYNPIKTRLLKEAEAVGARAIGGLDMLVWQGALAFEKWTGLKAPVELMRKEVIKALEGHEN